MKLWQFLSGAIVAVALIGCSETATNQAAEGIQNVSVVSGTITYRDRSALPDNALITVVLADASVSNKPAKIISQIIFPAGQTQAPFQFRLPYTQSQIVNAKRIIVTAEIELDNQLLYTNSNVNEVLTNNKNQVSLVLDHIN